MKLTKFTHACVRLEGDSGTLVIDPGIWSEPHALLGADAVLVTHEHSDHVDRLRLAGLGAPVYAPAGAVIRDLDYRELRAGETVELAGFRVSAIGGRHAPVYEGRPDCTNLGYIIDSVLYHPGDSLLRPTQRVEVLLVPAHASWLKTSEAVEFVRDIAPVRAFAIHDGQVNDRGMEGVNHWLSSAGGTEYRWLAPGDSAII